MFLKIVTGAVLAGCAAGLIAALLHLVFVQPTLLHAELYETGMLEHFGGDINSARQDTGGLDPARDGLTVLFTMLIYTGYAALLLAGMALAAEWGVPITPREGLVWGIAGFVAVQLAPAAGLPPEVPGMAAAEIGTRQIWWFGTVAATATGLALLAFGTSWAAWGGAIALLLAPHLIGAPGPESFLGPTPPEIASLFAMRVMAVGLVAWTILGAIAARMWSGPARGRATA